MNPTLDERNRIRAAMDRILSGTAEHSNGALGERGAPSEVETRLRATIAARKKTIANKNAELAQLRADVPALVRTVNQLTLENQELRETLANPSAEVIPIRGRRSRHTED